MPQTPGNGLTKFFAHGGILYGTIYTLWRGFFHLRSILTTWFYRRAIVECGAGTMFQPGIYIAYPRQIQIGKDCYIGEKVTVTSDFSDARLVIGNSVQVTAGTYIDYTGDLVIEDGAVISNAVWIFTHDHGRDPHSTPIRSPLVIEEGALIGNGAMILSGVHRIGRAAFIGAGAVVDRPVPAGASVMGNRARMLMVTEAPGPKSPQS